MNQELMAQYLRSLGSNAPQAMQQIGQYLNMLNQRQAPQQLAAQSGLAGLQAPTAGMQIGGFRSPQLPQGGMGSAQNMLVPQNGVIR